MGIIKLSDIVDGIEMQNDTYSTFFDRELNVFISVNTEYFDFDGEISEYSEWEQNDINLAIQVDEEMGTRYISLPTAWDINEYSIMKKFAFGYNDDRISNQLINSIQGRGAFRRFKDTASRLNVIQEWYTFRDKALQDIARDWCEINEIEYDE